MRTGSVVILVLLYISDDWMMKRCPEDYCETFTSRKYKAYCADFESSSRVNKGGNHLKCCQRFMVRQSVLYNPFYIVFSFLLFLQYINTEMILISYRNYSKAFSLSLGSIYKL